MCVASIAISTTENLAEIKKNTTCSPSRAAIYVFTFGFRICFCFSVSLTMVKSSLCFLCVFRCSRIGWTPNVVELPSTRRTSRRSISLDHNARSSPIRRLATFSIAIAPSRIDSSRRRRCATNTPTCTPRATSTCQSM